MKSIVGIKDKKNSEVVLDGFRCDKQLAQELNKFYLRFDTPGFRDVIQEQKAYLCDSGPTPFDLFDLSAVITTFRHSRARKSPGPDNICSRLLISCASSPALNNLVPYSITFPNLL